MNNYNSMFASDIVDTILNGPSDVGGKCPEPSYRYKHSGKHLPACCCEDACCWGWCRSKFPPKDCLDGVPGAEWKYFDYDGSYKAVRTSEIDFCFNYFSFR